MKTFIFIFSLTVFLIGAVSCNKDKQTAAPVLLSDSLDGGWELRMSQGGLAITKMYPPGNGNIVRFSNGKYAAFNNGQLIDSNHYIMQQDLFYDSVTVMNHLLFTGGFTSNYFYTIENNTLNLYQGWIIWDGGIYTYTRIENASKIGK